MIGLLIAMLAAAVILFIYAERAEELEDFGEVDINNKVKRLPMKL